MSRASTRGEKRREKLTFRSINWIQEWPLIGSQSGVIIGSGGVVKSLINSIEIQHIRIVWLDDYRCGDYHLRNWNILIRTARLLFLLLLRARSEWSEEAEIHSIQIRYRNQHICQFKIHKMQSFDTYQEHFLCLCLLLKRFESGRIRKWSVQCALNKIFSLPPNTLIAPVWWMFTVNRSWFSNSTILSISRSDRIE